MRLAGTATAIELGTLSGVADGKTRVRLHGGNLYVDSGSETQLTISGLNANQIELDQALCDVLCAKIREKIQELPHPEHPIAQPPQATEPQPSPHVAPAGRRVRDVRGDK